MKISIGIPTIAGRTEYLASALKTCLAQDDHDFEVVVSDNSPGCARALVEGLADPRVRYVRPDSYLPMAQHWDFMLTHFTGDVVTIIGDDDGLMPGSLRRVRELTGQYGLHPVRHSLAQYGWPDYPDEAIRDKFWFVHPPGPGVRLVPSTDFLAALCGARQKYIDGPVIYHNFVPRRVVQGLAINGSVFHRSSPDIYSAITIAAHTDHYIVTEEVLTLSGVSARSNGAAVRDGRGEGQRFLQEMKVARYDSRYESVTVQMHTLDSILEAIERYGRSDLLDLIDFGEHFCAAANECLDMPNRGRGLRQLLVLAGEAWQGDCFGYVVRNRGAKLIEKIRKRLARRTAKEVIPSLYTPGVRSTLPPQVADVQAAADHLHRLLAQQPT